jgi:hypothetical protein
VPVLFEIEDEEDAARLERGSAPVRSDNAEEMLGLANGIGRVAEMIGAPKQTGARGRGLAGAVVGIALEAGITRFMNNADDAFAFHGVEIDPHQIVMRHVYDAVSSQSRHGQPDCDEQDAKNGKLHRADDNWRKQSDKRKGEVCGNDPVKTVWLAQLLAARVDPQPMDIRRAVLILVAGIVTTSCSDKSASEKHSEVKREADSVVAKDEEESQPGEEEIAEQCVDFVRLTKVVSAQTPTAACPGCPPAGAEALAFRQMKTDRISCSGDTCTVLVTIRVSFKPGAGERMAGGLTAWISPEQRNAYLSGQTPSGEQAYRVQITYKRRGEAWRAVEFDRAPGE